MIVVFWIFVIMFVLATIGFFIDLSPEDEDIGQ